MPTFFPGWMRVPSWRIKIFPARTFSPPKTLTPRRCPWLSLPLRELPPAFLCAIAPILRLALYLDDFKRGQLLAGAPQAAVALAPLLLEDQHLLRQPLVDDLRRDLDARQRRRA